MVGLFEVALPLSGEGKLPLWAGARSRAGPPRGPAAPDALKPRTDEALPAVEPSISGSLAGPISGSVTPNRQCGGSSRMGWRR